MKSKTLRGYRLALLTCCMAVLPAAVFAAPARHDGVTLTIACENDQFARVLADMAPEFTKATGAKVDVDIMSYPELATKTIADFVGHTKGYDIVTMDIVWSGQFEQAGYTVDLTDWIKRDTAELDLDDIYPSLMHALGGYDGKQVAYPFAGYANVLAYRKDLYEKAGLKPADTMEEHIANIAKLTDKANKIYGFVANGQKGPAAAQDWMQYNMQLGGSILGSDGKPTLNSDANVASLATYKELFDKYAPPGAADYDWGGREESFRQGLVANMQTWSVGAADYDNPKISKVVGEVGIKLPPTAKGVPPQYGIGGWGLAINADISDAEKAAAWDFIKWIDSRPAHKEMNMRGAGSYIRKSELTDPDLLKKYPFLPVVAEAFEKGNGDFRPRIPQYPEIQDALGTAVNAALVGNGDPKSVLDAAQAKVVKLFK
jgi:multiple sugar transport system substrate-binding protein